MSVDAGKTSEDFGSVSDGVDGGKVWTPEQDDNVGFPFGPVAILSSLTGVFLWVFSKGFAGEYEGEMTLSLWQKIWNETSILSAMGFFATLTLLLFFLIPFINGKKYLFVTGLALLIGFGTMAHIINVQGKPEPLKDWFASEYNYGVLDSETSEYRLVQKLDSGKGLSVKDLGTGKVKIVNSYIVDDVVYLASDEDDLNEQLEARNKETLGQ